MSFGALDEARGTRRDVLALCAASGAVLAAAMPIGRAAGQEATPEASPEDGSGGPRVDSAFSSKILPMLGLRTIDLTMSADGLAGAPAEVPGGELLVNWTTEGVVGYLLFARPAEGLTEEQELEQAKQAGSNDLPQEGWVYGGGANADPDTTVQVVVRLTPGAWTLYASHMDPAGTFETDEIYTLTRLTVTGDAAGPLASPVADPDAALPVDVTVEMHDAAYAMGTDTVGVGPKLWAFPNVGESQSHHVVMVRTTKLVESADIDALVAAFSSEEGVPPDWFLQVTFVGYTALVSPGYVAYNEFSLDEGSHLMLCFIVDTETRMPHFAMGMWAAFTVEA